MPAPVIPAVLAAFALGGLGGFARRAHEAKTAKEQKELDTMMRVAGEQAAAGNVDWLMMPENQKAFKRLGAEHILTGYAQIAKAPIAQEHRAALLETARGERTAAQLRGQALAGLAGRAGEFQVAGLPPGAAARETLAQATPEERAQVFSAPAAQVGAQERAATAQVGLGRERIAAEKEMSTADREARLKTHAEDIRVREAELEQRREAEQGTIGFRRDQLQLERDRNEILRQEQDINRRKMKEAKDEATARIAAALFTEGGVPAKASKEIADFMMGRISGLSEDVAKLTGIDKTTLDKAMTLYKQGDTMRSQARQLIDTIYKNRGALSEAEIQTRVNQANDQMREAYGLMVQSQLMSQAEAEAALNNDLKEFVPRWGKDAIVSPGIARQAGSAEFNRVLQKHQKNLPK